jgi:hypothetical protein
MHFEPDLEHGSRFCDRDLGDAARLRFAIPLRRLVPITT